MTGLQPTNKSTNLVPSILVLILVLSFSVLMAINMPSAWAASCKDYKTQQEAQKAADTLDPDNDGKYCENLPDDPSAASGLSQSEINARKSKAAQQQTAQRRAAKRKADSQRRAAKRRAAHKRAAKRKAAQEKKTNSQSGEGSSGGIIAAIVFILLALGMVWSVKRIVRRHKDKKLYKQYQQSQQLKQSPQLEVNKQASGGGNQQRPAGWYLDPRTTGQMRWWDGNHWGQETRPANNQQEGPAAAQQRPNRPVQSQQRQAQPTTPPPGWHPDPSNPQQLRWWDGKQWTNNTHPKLNQSGQ